MGQSVSSPTPHPDLVNFLNLPKDALDSLWSSYSLLNGRLGLNLGELVTVFNLPNYAFTDTQLTSLFNAFDSDRNGLIDVIELFVTIALRSGMDTIGKIHFAFSAYDFDNAGSLSFGEATLLLRSVVQGLGKVSPSNAIVTSATFEEIEKFTALVFMQSNKGTSRASAGRITTVEFKNYCSFHPVTSSWLKTVAQFPAEGAPDSLCVPLGNPSVLLGASANSQKTASIVAAQNPNAPMLPNWAVTVDLMKPEDALTDGRSDAPEDLFEPIWLTGVNTTRVGSELAPPLMHRCVKYANMTLPPVPEALPEGEEAPPEVLGSAASQLFVMKKEEETGWNQRLFNQHSAAITCLDVHYPKNLLVTAENNGAESRVVIWNLETFAVTKTIPTRHGVKLLDISENGTLLLVVTTDLAATCTMYDIATGKVVFARPLLLGPRTVKDCVTDIRFTGTSAMFAVSSAVQGVTFYVEEGGSFMGPDGLKLYEERSGLYQAIGRPAVGAAVTELCRFEGTDELVAGTDKGQLLVWHGRTVAQLIDAHRTAVNALDFNKLSLTLISGGADGIINIYNLAGHVAPASLKTKKTPQLVVPRMLQLSATFDILRHDLCSYAIRSLALSADSRRALVTTSACEVLELALFITPPTAEEIAEAEAAQEAAAQAARDAAIAAGEPVPDEGSEEQKGDEVPAGSGIPSLQRFLGDDVHKAPILSAHFATQIGAPASVTALCRMPLGGFASCGADGTVRWWQGTGGNEETGATTYKTTKVMKMDSGCSATEANLNADADSQNGAQAGAAALSVEQTRPPPEIDIKPDLLSDKIRSIHRSQSVVTSLFEADVESHGSSAAPSFMPLRIVVLEDKEAAANGSQSMGIIHQGIDAEQLFASLVEGAAAKESCRVLMTGIPGVGKSTMLKHWCSKWSSNDLWPDKFDYVFLVKLKLISGDWKLPYGQHFDLHPLQCFLHHCLVEDAVDNSATSISVEEIIATGDSNRVLLLLDGYDEVAHLASDSSKFEFQIIREALQYKNVLMTARPNSVNKQTEHYFDRKTENVGMDSQSVHLYIRRRFGEASAPGKELLSFLATNTQVLDICKVPINIALVCLIWSDPHSRSRFDQNFKVGTLYQQIVVWLGKSYLQKAAELKGSLAKEGKVAAAVSEQAVLSAQEVVFQTAVACDAFSSSSGLWYLVSSLLVRRTLNRMEFTDKEAAIREICKYGLLRPMKKTTDLLEQDFAFFHLTFQEFLTAHHVKDELLSSDPARVAAAVDFIGVHRTDPRYFPVLTMLSGLVSSERAVSTEAQTALVQRFWVAAVCNIDGVIEVGVDRKATLLFHLLSQAEVDGQLDRRSSLIVAAVKFLDNLVWPGGYNMVGNYCDAILQSGFLSPMMQLLVQTKLQECVKGLWGDCADFPALLRVAQKFKHRFGVEEVLGLLFENMDGTHGPNLFDRARTAPLCISIIESILKDISSTLPEAELYNKGRKLIKCIPHVRFYAAGIMSALRALVVNTSGKVDVALPHLLRFALGKLCYLPESDETSPATEALLHYMLKPRVKADCDDGGAVRLAWACLALMCTEYKNAIYADGLHAIKAMTELATTHPGAVRTGDIFAVVSMLGDGGFYSRFDQSLAEMTMQCLSALADIVPAVDSKKARTARSAVDVLFEIAFPTPQSFTMYPMHTVICSKESLTLLKGRVNHRKQYLRALIAPKGCGDCTIVEHRVKMLESIAGSIPDSDVEKVIDFTLKAIPNVIGFDTASTSCRLLSQLLVRRPAKSQAVVASIRAMNSLFIDTAKLLSMVNVNVEKTSPRKDGAQVQDALQGLLAKEAKSDTDYKKLWSLQSQLPDYKHIEAVVKALVSGMVSNGPTVTEVFKKLAKEIRPPVTSRVVQAVLDGCSQLVFTADLQAELLKILKLLVESQQRTGGDGASNTNLKLQIHLHSGCSSGDGDTRRVSRSLLSTYSTQLPRADLQAMLQRLFAQTQDAAGPAAVTALVAIASFDFLAADDTMHGQVTQAVMYLSTHPVESVRAAAITTMVALTNDGAACNPDLMRFMFAHYHDKVPISAENRKIYAAAYAALIKSTAVQAQSWCKQTAKPQSLVRDCNRQVQSAVFTALIRLVPLLTGESLAVTSEFLTAQLRAPYTDRQACFECYCKFAAVFDFADVMGVATTVFDELKLNLLYEAIADLLKVPLLRAPVLQALLVKMKRDGIDASFRWVFVSAARSYPEIIPSELAVQLTNWMFESNEPGAFTVVAGMLAAVTDTTVLREAQDILFERSYQNYQTDRVDQFKLAVQLVSRVHSDPSERLQVLISFALKVASSDIQRIEVLFLNLCSVSPEALETRFPEIIEWFSGFNISSNAYISPHTEALETFLATFVSLFSREALQRFVDQAVLAIEKIPDETMLNTLYYALKSVLPKLDPASVMRVVHAVFAYYASKGALFKDEGCTVLFKELNTCGDALLSEVLQVLLQDPIRNTPNTVCALAEHLSLQSCWKFYSSTLTTFHDFHPIFVRFLADKLGAEQEHLTRTFDEKTVEMLLSIIGVQSATVAFESADRQRLIEASKSALLQINPLFSVEMNASWAAEKMDVLLAMSNEALTCYDQYYKNVLSSGNLTASNSPLVALCIWKGFTTSITKPKRNADGTAEFSLNYNGVAYRFVSKHAVQLAALLTKVVVTGSTDLLAAQYKNYVPLFPNLGAVGNVAAVDLPAMSVVDSTCALRCDTVLASYVRPQQQVDGSVEAPLLLFERRSYFGDYEVDVAVLEATTGAVPVELAATITMHPQLLNAELRQTLFGWLRDGSYTVSSITMPREHLVLGIPNVQLDCLTMKEATDTKTTDAEKAQIIMDILASLGDDPTAPIKQATFTSKVVTRTQLLVGVASGPVSVPSSVPKGGRTYAPAPVPARVMSATTDTPIDIQEKPAPLETVVATENHQLVKAKIFVRKDPSSFTVQLQQLYASQDSLPKLIDDPQMQAQSMQDYYVKLNIVMREKEGSRAVCYDKVLGDKDSIEMEEILGDAAKFQSHSHRVLLLGGAGVGKTTLMHFVAYRWSRDELWADRFDYVFRIKLRLVTNNWRQAYGSDLDKQALKCFIHYCLVIQGMRVARQELFNITDTSRVLLLMDGYDEIAHLANNINQPEYLLIQEVLAYPHVIMTSRPNAIDRSLEDRFDRKVENIGLDQVGINKYIGLNFRNDKALETEICNFLSDNIHVQEICTIPINTALLCLIWHDPQVRRKFATGIEVSQLYHELVSWLGKRYFVKFKDRELCGVTEDMVFSCPQLQCTTDLAYYGLVSGSLAVDVKVVAQVTSKPEYGDILLGDVVKFGLIHPGGSDRNIAEQAQYFVHLTFQEYLCACFLKERLCSAVTAEETSFFIMSSRYEPRYLMVWKFLASMVLQDACAGSPAVFDRFWDCVLCNIDGLLEFGVDKKLALLLTLLAQYPEHVRSAPGRIREVCEVVERLIDARFEEYGQLLIATGYHSEAVYECAVRVITAQLTVENPDYRNARSAHIIVAINVIIRHAAKNRGVISIANRICYLLVWLLDYRIYQSLLLRSLASILTVTPILSITGALVGELAKLAPTGRISFHPDLLVPLKLQMPAEAVLYTPQPQSDPRTQSTGWSKALHSLTVVDQQYTDESVLWLSKHLTRICQEATEFDRIRLLLVILGNLSDFRSQRGNEVYKEATERLTTLSSQQSEETVRLISQNFAEFTTLSAHSVEFCKKALRVMLAAECISAIHAEFMFLVVADKHCAISIDREFVVTIDSARCHLSGAENKARMAAVLHRLVDTGSGQSAALQLCAHTVFSAPSFALVSKETRAAAIDVRNVSPVARVSKSDAANSSCTLVPHAWQLAFLHLSDQDRSSAKAVHLLLERRNDFGDVEVHRISTAKNGTFEVKVLREHPAAINSEFIEKVFGPMHYLTSKPCYYATAFEISLASGNKILMDHHHQSDAALPEVLQALAVEEGPHSAYIRLRALVLRALSHALGGADNTDTTHLTMQNNGLLRPWNQYAADATKLSKYEIFSLVNGSTAWLRTRQDSIRVDGQLRVNDLADTTSELALRLEDVERSLSNINIRDLEALTIREKLLQSEQVELQAVLASPYKRAFYEALRWQLNSVYLACTAISTNMVANESRGMVGSVGSFLEGISAHTPLVGIGLSVIGQILQGIDQGAQEERVLTFAKIAIDSTEMAGLAEGVARKIAINIDQLDITADASEGYCRAFIETLSNAEIATGDSPLTNGVVALTVMVFQSIKKRLRAAKSAEETEAKGASLMGYMRRFVAGEVQDMMDPCVRGEAHSEIVSRLLVRSIFGGAFANATAPKQKRDMMVSIVQEKYVRAASMDGSAFTTDRSVGSSTMKSAVQPVNPTKNTPADTRDRGAGETSRVAPVVTPQSRSAPEKVPIEERIAREALAVCLMIADCDHLTPASVEKDNRFLLRLSVALRKHSQLLAHPSLEETEVVDVLGRHLHGTILISSTPCGTKYCLDSKFLRDDQYFIGVLKLAEVELTDKYQVSISKDQIQSGGNCVVS